MSETKPSETKPSVAIALGIICIVLVVVGLVGALIYVMPMINLQISQSYNSGFQAGLTSRGFNIADPTYQEMLNFMATDTVHNNVYNSTYICWNFCNDYINEAFGAGLRCGFVYIEFPDSAHGVVCFNTTNRGIVFVEPQFDRIVQVTIGSSYSRSNGFAPTTYNDTIVDFGIIW